MTAFVVLSAGLSSAYHLSPCPSSNLGPCRAAAAATITPCSFYAVASPSPRPPPSIDPLPAPPQQQQQQPPPPHPPPHAASRRLTWPKAPWT